MNAFAYLGIRSREEFGRMTLNEYLLRIEAYRLAKIERFEELHMQAFLNFSVQAMEDKKGTKPKYKTFNQFYNKQEDIDEVRSTFEPNYVPKTGNGRTKQATYEQMLAMQNYNKKIMEERRNANGGKL